MVLTVASEVEFSNFFKLMESIKKGDEEGKELLKKTVAEYENGENAESYLQELGQLCISIGVKKLYEYTSETELKIIGSINKEGWEKLASTNEQELPQYLAGNMIKDINTNKAYKNISKKWNTRDGEIKKHITRMARYITEGIIDVLE